MPRFVGPKIFAMLAALAIATVAVAGAKGVTLVQQSDGTAKTYLDVSIRLDGQTLLVQSADQKGVLEISTAACTLTSAIQRCLPYAVRLIQGGQSRAIAIKDGTVILNLSNTAQRVSASSEELAPRTALALLRTQHGTYVTIKGTIDEMAK